MKQTLAQAPFGLGVRLLAEAVRLREDTDGGPAPDGAADRAARDAGGDFEHRLLVRARLLPLAAPLAEAFRHLRQAVAAALLIGLALAFAAGAAAAQLALSPDGDVPVNVFWLLGSLLGVHTLALVAWLLLTLVRRHGSGGLFGSAVVALASRLDRLLHRGPAQTAAARSTASMLAGSAVGRWTVGAISHGLWLAFLAGCLALVLLMLGARQYNFAWETTILSPPSYVAITRTLSLVPAMLGFPVPDNNQIATSRWTGQGAPPASARRAWAGLIIGSIVTYGVVPRAVALALTLVAARRAGRRWRLDTSRVGYARLRARLMPPTRAIGVVDPDSAEAAGVDDARVQAPLQLTVGGEGPLALLGLEIEPPASPWPPSLPAMPWTWLDLGFVDSGADRQRVTDALAERARALRLIVIVCALPATPDRGLRAFIAELQRVAQTPAVLILTGGQRLRERARARSPDGEQASPVVQRIADWQAMAVAAGIPQARLLDLDLDHVTDVSGGKLHRFLETVLAPTDPSAAAIAPASDAGGVGDDITPAFALIVGHAARWRGNPSAAEQTEVQAAIARLYRGRSSVAGAPWRSLLHLPADRVVGDGTLPRLDEVADGARRMVELLPARLRASPRWLAAGAVAGAVGCLAATALVSPIAITALPAWAGLGAGLGSALAAVVPGGGTQEPADGGGIDLGEAVTGAALFAVLLHLQGRDEASITRIIDAIAGDDDPPKMAGPEDARAWLDPLGRRFAAVLAAEAVP